MSGQSAFGRRSDFPDAVEAHRAPVAIPRPEHAPEASASVLAPLVIDLDAHLPGGLGWEIALGAARARPTALPRLAVEALRDRAAFARSASTLAGSALAAIPLGPVLQAALARSEAEGRAVYLLTAAHPALAEGLRAARPGIAGVIVAPGGEAVAELARTAAVRARCPAGFVVPYGIDPEAPWARGAPAWPAWPAASAAPAEDPAANAAAPSRARLWARALRLHQWAKNLLVFAPLVLAGQALEPAAWLAAAAGFLAFGFAASSTYLLNDLHDLAHDRAHRSKRHRPLASGALAIPHALLAAALGLAASLGLAATGGVTGLATVGAYLALTLAYTLAIKRYPVLDTVTLAGLFTLRLLGGIAFCGVAGSPWLLAFSMFVFTSLALAKRAVEIDQLAGTGREAIAGRGYVLRDGPTVLALGAATSACAVLILSLYIVEAPARSAFYRTPDLLWAAPIALFLWLGRIWLLCGRGALRDDPVEFALRDRPSLGLGLVLATGFALACLPF